jgi:hypothetical protein
MIRQKKDRSPSDLILFQARQSSRRESLKNASGTHGEIGQVIASARKKQNLIDKARVDGASTRIAQHAGSAPRRCECPVVPGLRIDWQRPVRGSDSCAREDGFYYLNPVRGDALPTCSTASDLTSVARHVFWVGEATLPCVSCAGPKPVGSHAGLDLEVRCGQGSLLGAPE